MKHFGEEIHTPKALDLEKNFWNNFESARTLSNVVEHFIRNFSYDDEYRESFAIVIVRNQLIKKRISKRKLMEIIHVEIKKVDVTKPQIQNKNDPAKTNIQKLSIFQADRLDGNAFQDFVAELLKSDGFSDVEVTGKSGDQGGDILANKNEKKYVFQVKRYSIDNKVSNSAVQEANGAVPYYDANIGIVITNSFYTNGAKELASKIGIELWNRQKVMKLIENFNNITNT